MLLITASQFILKWLFWLYAAMFVYDRSRQLYNSIKTDGLLSKLNSTTTAGLLSKSTPLSYTHEPMKSDNYVPSKADEQQLLRQFEEQLIACDLKKPIETSRWEASKYPPVTSLPDSVYSELSRVIICSSGLQTDNHPCISVKGLVGNSLYGLKTDKRIIFGFRMKLETEPVSASRFRIKLHDHFLKKLWPFIKESVNFATETREIVFVGYESGGALATLAAWHAIKQFEATKSTGLIVTNGNNQVKVLTWDEMPLFTQQTASKSPILPQNHSRFLSSAISDSIYRKIAQKSGGIDEIQYFASSGDAIHLKATDYADFASRAVEFAVKTKKKDEEDWTALPRLPRFFKQKQLRDLPQDRIENLAELLKLHHLHASILQELISNHYRAYIVEHLLVEPNSCAASIANQLSTTIFPDSAISCRVNDFFVDEGTFEIHCSYRSVNNKTLVQFLSFDAVLGDEKNFKDGNNCAAFMVEEEVPVGENDKKKKNNGKKSRNDPIDDNEVPKTTVKVKKYFGPRPVLNSWSNCLYELFEQTPHLSPISPFTISNKTAYPRCSYAPFASFLPRPTGKNTGCYFRSPNVSHELLQLYRSDPRFFYKTVEPRSMLFPEQCIDNLFNIPFKANERGELESLQQLAVDYLTELVKKNPLADSEVTLWRPRDTSSFNTVTFHGSSHISLKDLANRDNYAPDFENLIIKCLSNPSYPYRDCTDKHNQWVPGACPAACTQTHGSISFLCKQVKSCPAAGYYVSVASEGTADKLSDIEATLNRKPNPQFGIFHVLNRVKGYFWTDQFNVALFRMPLNA